MSPSSKSFFLNPCSIAILIGVAMLLSCQGDLETIRTITQSEEPRPVEEARNVEVIYSSYAKIRMTLNAPRMIRYNVPENHVEMPEGIKVVFFDSLMNQTATLSARYAVNYLDRQVFETRYDVVVVNEQNEILNTEQLIWDQNRGIIYTEKFVKITTQDEVLFGEGFESDERFTQWKIKQPRGTFSVETGPGGTPR
ncbi:MAG TPA: LPS export ABC transporter periplasmic protein LptC [Bacteroidales bacterium]|nr:LPS export ABC transporter periplasmic protein LptC [Bacteroidales bacterium]